MSTALVPPRAPALAGAALTAVGALLLAPAGAQAHGLTGRTDLPLPDWLFIWGAGVVLVVSFVALALLWPSPRLEAAGGRALSPRVGRTLTHPALQVVCGAIGVALLALVVYAGFAGANQVSSNITPTFVYIIFWLGLVPASVLFGDVFRAFNPWLAAARLAGRALGHRRPPPLPYPDWLGYWPAAIGLLGFAWIELVSVRGDRPQFLATTIVVYSASTWVAMAVYGSDTWSRRGEAFSVYFNLLSRLSPVDARERMIILRAPLSGLTRVPALPGLVAVVVVMIATVTFDGFSGGAVWQRMIPDLLPGAGRLKPPFLAPLEVVYTLGMLFTLAAVAGFYLAAIAGIRAVAGGDIGRLARAFAPSLVPIAFAYVAAHYVSLLVLQGQSIAALASDPLGNGSDLVGTARWGVDYTLLSANAFWYLQLGFVIAGHIAGLALAHDRALTLYDDAKRAIRSQCWMLGAMIGFTCLALWLLSEVNKG